MSAITLHNVIGAPMFAVCMEGTPRSSFQKTRMPTFVVHCFCGAPLLAGRGGEDHGGSPVVRRFAAAAEEKTKQDRT